MAKLYTYKVKKCRHCTFSKFGHIQIENDFPPLDFDFCKNLSVRRTFFFKSTYFGVFYTELSLKLGNHSEFECNQM